MKVRKIVAAHDVGRTINPTLVEGQIHGGIAQGLGLALMEEFIPGRTENLHDYLIPTFGDMPDDRHHPDRGPRAARPLRRQGHRRAGPDPHRPRHPRRHPPRHRRHHPQGAGAAASRARGAGRRGAGDELLTPPVIPAQRLRVRAFAPSRDLARWASLAAYPGQPRPSLGFRDDGSKSVGLAGMRRSRRAQ